LQAIESGKKHIMCTLPTGGGKTHIMHALAEHYASQKKRVLFVVHRTILRDQFGAKVKGMYRDLVEDRTIQTWHKEYVKDADGGKDFDLVLIDEAHRSNTKGQYGDLFDRYFDSQIIGFSATPVRTDGQPLSVLYEQLIQGPSTKMLIEAGYLSGFTVYGERSYSTDGMRKANRKSITKDIKNSDLEQWARGKDVADLLKAYREHANGLSMVVFASSIKHADAICEMYRNAGYRCAVVSGEMSDNERNRLFMSEGSDFRMKRLNILVTADLLLEGVDIPEIQCIQIVRPTQSIIVHQQMIGRGLRKHATKPPDGLVILDHVGNCKELGPPDQERVWSLDNVSDYSLTFDFSLSGVDMEDREVVLDENERELDLEYKSASGTIDPYTVDIERLAFAERWPENPADEFRISQLAYVVLVGARSHKHESPLAVCLNQIGLVSRRQLSEREAIVAARAAGIEPTSEAIYSILTQSAQLCAA